MVVVCYSGDTERALCKRSNEAVIGGMGRMRRAKYFVAGAVLCCAASGSVRAQDAAPQLLVVTETAAAQQLKSRMSIEYPREAIDGQISGAVKLQILVSPEGFVIGTRVLSGPAALATAAEDAVLRASYAPMLAEGKPVYMATTIRLIFSMDTTMKPPWTGVRESLAKEGQAEDAAALTAEEPFAHTPGTNWDNGKPKTDGVRYNVNRAQLIYQVQPAYPSAARSAHVEGTVTMHAIIEKNGTVSHVTYVSGPMPLSGAAIDAVKQWKYAPTKLAGMPVEVDTTISVTFTLGE